MRYIISNINPSTYRNEFELLIKSFLPNSEIHLFIKPKQNPTFVVLETENLANSTNQSTDIDNGASLDLDIIDDMLFGGYKLKVSTTNVLDSKPKSKKSKKKKKNKKADIDEATETN